MNCHLTCAWPPPLIRMRSRQCWCYRPFCNNFGGKKCSARKNWRLTCRRLLLRWSWNSVKTMICFGSAWRLMVSSFFYCSKVTRWCIGQLAGFSAPIRSPGIRRERSNIWIHKPQDKSNEMREFKWVTQQSLVASVWFRYTKDGKGSTKLEVWSFIFVLSVLCALYTEMTSPNFHKRIGGQKHARH